MGVDYDLFFLKFFWQRYFFSLPQVAPLLNSNQEKAMAQTPNNLGNINSSIIASAEPMWLHYHWQQRHITAVKHPCLKFQQCIQSAMNSQYRTLLCQSIYWNLSNSISRLEIQIKMTPWHFILFDSQLTAFLLAPGKSIIHIWVHWATFVIVSIFFTNIIRLRGTLLCSRYVIFLYLSPEEIEIDVWHEFG